MVYTTIIQPPEDSIVEKWVWRTNILTADDGTEQRISLSELPKRSYSGRMTFETVAKVRRHMALMYAGYSNTFKWPAFHIQTKLKAKVAAASDTMYLNPVRSDFRAGATAIIIEGDKFETFTVDEINTDHITAVAGLANSYSTKAMVMPLMTVYTQPGASVVRKPVDSFASVNFEFYEYGFQDPFILEDDEVVLPTYKGLPVLAKRSVGIEFESALFTGAEITDYGGFPNIRDRWDNSNWGFALNFLWHRTFTPEDIYFWKTFADYCRGGTNPFYYPSTRSDFEVLTPGVGTGTSITLKGTEYSQHYYVVDSMQDIVVTKPDGTQHYAEVTGVASGSGNDVLTISPALPAGDWTDQTVGFMYLLRIEDNAITLSHFGLDTMVGMNVRTTDG